MFVMTSDIRIEMKDGRTAQVKPAAVRWKSDAKQLFETCVIELPLYPYLKSNTEATDIYSGEKECAFAVGGRVNVKVGYDGDNNEVFDGFVAAINYGERLELTCEGWAYLFKGTIFTKSYRTVELKKLLADLTEGTGIELSAAIPGLKIKNATFNNIKGIDVLEWLKKELLCSVVFRGRNLYAGASLFGEQMPHQKLRLGWNVVKDDNFKKQPTKADIQINIVAKDSKGKSCCAVKPDKRFKSIKTVRVKPGLDAGYLKKVVARLQHEANTEGRQEGKLTCFLVPYFIVGMVAEVSDSRYPERNGSYFVQAVEGSFTTSGGRQVLTLKSYER